MYVIVWECQARKGYEAEIEKAYGPGGVWNDFFKRGIGYRGTELLRDGSSARRYITIDRWESPEAYAAFCQDSIGEYEAIDARCDELTEREVLLGTFASVAA